MNYDITILTAEQYLNPLQPDWYVSQILQEDKLIQTALEQNGFRVHRIDWTNKRFDWSDTTAVLFRAVWDYTQRYEEFQKFLNTVSTQTTLINPLKTILWNLDKHYLHDLQRRGINIPKTVYIEKGTHTSLELLHKEWKFADSILKPVMSAGARHTYRLNPNNRAEHEKIFQQLISEEAMMLQPFLHSVMTHGEVTLMVIGGKYTHAVLKKTKPGDFRVQDDYGGTVHAYSPTQVEIDFAETTVAACTPMPVYARVDLLQDENGNPAVSELELIEPELWFRFYPSAADRLAEEIQKMF
ncbi:MAG: hypothetical protein WCW40_08645 [Bacteroidota bacterium]